MPGLFSLGKSPGSLQHLTYRGTRNSQTETVNPQRTSQNNLNLIDKPTFPEYLKPSPKTSMSQTESSAVAQWPAFAVLTV